MSPPTDPAESEIDVEPVVWVDIDEHEHQALDLLDENPRESAQDTVPRERAAAVVRSLLPRVGTTVARTLIDAAAQLAQTEHRGRLELAALDEIRLTLTEHPRLSLAIAPTVETLGTILGLDREGAAWAILLELAEQAHAEADERLHACSSAIAERLAAAQATFEGSVARDLRVFRSAAAAHAGPSIRARQLAADHPEHLALALALVDHHTDAAALVDAFDHARALLAADVGERATPDAAPKIDGPKRKFTYVHLILALIVLALTVWHYVFR